MINSCSNKTLILYQGYPSRWDDVDWLSLKFSGVIDLTGFSAKFKLGSFTFENNDLTQDWIINFTKEQTATFPIGPNTASLIVYDRSGEGKPFTTSIPVLVKNWVEGDVDIDTYKATINATLENETQLSIRIETAKVSLDWVTEQIQQHNNSESAHSYIQGLISNEKNARENADNLLSQRITQNTDRFANYRTASQQNIIDNNQNTEINNKQDKLTTSQMNAVNSGITSAKVSSYDSHITNNNIHVTTQDKTTWNNKQNALNTNQMAAVNSGANTTNIGQITTNKNAIGNLASLTTTSKTNLVSAINEVDGIAGTALQPSDVVNNTSSTATNKPLSANIGKSLQDQVDNLKARGRFLALWNCATGLAESNPPSGTYTYQSGDYFIVGVVAQSGGTNYKPDGSTYTTGVASTVVETQPVDTDDVYYYDGHVWRLQVNTQKEIGFVNIAGDPYDNTSLAGALNEKQNEIDDLDEIRSGASAGATALQPSALDGYATETWVGQQGFLTGISSSDVTTALGYTPYDSSNPAGYITNAALSGYAHTSLDNLDSTGQIIIDSQNGTISNCVLEIPQDIKVTYHSANAVVSSGTKYYMPDGEQYQTSNDMIVPGFDDDGAYMFFRGVGTGFICLVSDVVSGPTDPKAGQTYHVWYDTTNNIIKGYLNDTSTYRSLSFPLFVYTSVDGDVASIDQVFNGDGYIGHHVFILPGVKALVPSGYNDDGTLKSTVATTTSLSIREMQTGQAFTGVDRVCALSTTYTGFTGYTEVEKFSDIDDMKNWMVYYVKEENKNYQVVYYDPIELEDIILLSYNYDGTTVTRFNVRPITTIPTTDMLNDYATTSYVDTKIGDIETILHNINSGS